MMQWTHDYRQIGGAFPETSALANALLAQGIVPAQTGKPYSEAVLFGIGGGIGAGYILYQFAQHNTAFLILGFRNEWQYATGFLSRVCERIGVSTEVIESTGRKGAVQGLQRAMTHGKSVLAWVDLAHLPYRAMPPELDGVFGHVIGITRLAPDYAIIDDLGMQPFTLSYEALAGARERIGSYKNRLMLFAPQPTNTPDLGAAMRAGIRDCADGLLGTSESFALPTFAKWAKMLVDPKHKKGWRTAFPDGVGLYSALASLYEGVELFGTGGGAGRGLYADSLDATAKWLMAPSLHPVMAEYRALAGAWTAFAQTALPDSIPVLAETRMLLDQKYRLLRKNGDEGAYPLPAIQGRLNRLAAHANTHFPADSAARLNLLENLSAQLVALVDHERATALQLRTIEAGLGNTKEDFARV